MRPPGTHADAPRPQPSREQNAWAPFEDVSPPRGLLARGFADRCGAGRAAAWGASPTAGAGPALRDPVVAARVNGRPIYIEDVRAYAVQARHVGRKARTWTPIPTPSTPRSTISSKCACSPLKRKRAASTATPTCAANSRAARERVLADRDLRRDRTTSATDPEAVRTPLRENAARARRR